ncbi:MAG: hypothetical protein OXI30_21405 [Chloroflexota bacterium]|nr:hypothetical protein [Chloroflexota bacterium]
MKNGEGGFDEKEVLMKRIVLTMAVLLVGGLVAGSAFAQDADVMTLSPGGVVELSLMPDYECLSEIDFKDLGLSPDVFYPMLVSALYGIDVADGGGLSGGNGNKEPMICSYNWGYENCGSCLRTSRGNRKILYKEWWCLGIRVWRHEKCVYC